MFYLTLYLWLVLVGHGVRSADEVRDMSRERHEAVGETLKPETTLT